MPQHQLSIRLLGLPEILVNQIPLASLETVKASALVYYLAVTERVHGRAELAELFWPDSELKLARRNLRNRLVVIRNHLGDYFTITRESLQFKPHFANQVDIHQLAAAASAAECTADRARLRQTADLYRGDFLTNIHVTDAPLFEDWVTRTREETHTQMATILYRLSHLEAAQGNLAQANTDIDRLLSLVPWHEEAHRLKMQLLYQNGHRWAALEQYAALQDILREELDVPPDAETEHLINLIRLGESLEDTVLALPDKSPVQTNIHAPTMTHTPENIEPGTIDTGTIDAGTIDTADINATDINTADINAVDIDAVDIDATDIELALDKTDAQMASPTYQSPIPLTPLIGRGELLRTILDAIQDPTHRLITLMGMGGVGKTHMALTIGQRMRELQRADRNDEQVDIYFISLVGMEAMPRASQSETIPYAHEKQAQNRLASEVATALDLPIGSADTILQQVSDYLRHRKLLLIFDNFEHVLGCVPALARLLAEASSCVFLVTSRTRLQIPNETVFYIDPLPLPQADKATQIIAQQPQMLPKTYAAIQLFIDCAQRYSSRFHAHVDDFPHMLDICQLTGGLPLALEMVAAWTEHLTLADIAAQLRQDRTLLVHDASVTATGTLGVARHQTVDALIEHSWRLLSPEQQNQLMMLSHFATSFDFNAASAIVHISLLNLKRLTDTSLLQVKTVGRYALHPLTQAFLRDQWRTQYDDTSSETMVLWRHYCTYFFTLVVEQAARLDGAGVMDALTHLRREHNHIDLAWRQALHHRWFGLIEHVFDALTHFHTRNGVHQEVFLCCERLLEILDITPMQTFDAVPLSDSIQQRLRLHAGVIQMETHQQLAQHSEGLTVGLRLEPYLPSTLPNTLPNTQTADQPILNLEARYHLGMASLFLLAGELDEVQHHWHLAHPHLSEQSPSHLWGRYEMIFAFYTSFYNSNVDIGLQHGEKALAHYRRSGNLWGEADLLYEMGALLASYRSGSEAMKTYFQQSLRIRQQLHNRSGEAETLDALGNALGHASGHAHIGTSYLQRIAYLKAAIDIHNELGHEYRTYYTLVSLSSVYLALGQYAQVDAWLTPITNKQVVLDDPNLRYQVLGNLSMAACRQGRIEEAKTLAQQMLTLHGQVAKSQHALSYMALGDAFLADEALSDAETAFIQAFNLRQTKTNLGLQTTVRTGLAAVAYRQGKQTGSMDQALTHVHWLYPRLETKLPDPSGREYFWSHWVCYQVLQSVDDPRAHELLRQSYHQLRQWAEELTDEALRVSFLENVVVNRMIVEEVGRVKSHDDLT